MERITARSVKRSASQSADRQRASILVVTLWTLCLLAMFSVILGYGVRQKLMLVKRLDERERLYLIADAALKKALMQLKKEEAKGYDCLKDGWSNDERAFNGAVLGGGRFFVSYEYTDALSGNMARRFGLIDEESKININSASSRVIERLLKGLPEMDEMLAQEIAAAIVDWRDADSELSLPLGSAEDSYYQDLPHPYEAKDAEFESLDELRLVKGVSAALFEKIRPYLTVYGDGYVNVNTASKAVISALGLSENAAGAVMLFRAGEDGIAGTADDNVFDEASRILIRLQQFYSFTEAEQLQISVLAEQRAKVSSRYFSASISARLREAGNSFNAVSVFERSGKVVYWRET